MKNKKINTMNKKDVDKLNAYFIENLGINMEQFLNFEGELTNDMESTIYVVPRNYNHGIGFPSIIQKGSKIKVLEKNISQPLGYSNNILFKVMDSPIQFTADFRVSLKELVKSLRTKKSLKPK